MTFDEVYKIQADQLEQWRQRLNAVYYCALYEECAARNATGYTSPYDVFRGTDMSNFISNYQPE